MKHTQYEELPDNDNEESHPQRSRKSCGSSLNPFLLAILVVQGAIILFLLLLNLRPHSADDGVYLYSPAEGAVQYEVRTFFFGVGDDVSPFQQPPSPTLDQMWEDLYWFGINRIPKTEAERLPNKTSAIPGDPDGYYITELDVFHQLHCLNMIRQALHPEYYPEMRMGSTPQVDEHIGHCVDSLRQALMCAADTSAIVWQWDDAKQRAGFRSDVAHTCRNFDRIRDWARGRRLEVAFDVDTRVGDDIRVPVYRADDHKGLVINLVGDRL